MPAIALIGAYDTKADECRFLEEQIGQRSLDALRIDVGILGDPPLPIDLPASVVAQAGGASLESLRQARDRGRAIQTMCKGLPNILSQLRREKKIQGAIGLGGGGGTAIAAAGMRALPIGFPKLIVTTLASGNTAPYLAEKDIVLYPSIVDLAGLNRISREILARAAGAICGMTQAVAPAASDRPLIAASMFGNTTPCVQAARRRLEEAGFEVLVFHATGAGGRAMEALIESGWIAGALDVTTTEWADEYVGGILSAGPHRLEAAARAGVPAVVCPGCLDMVNFGPPETVPARFHGRRFYAHNPQVTLMRTTPEECRGLGEIVAEKLNRSTGPVTVIIPKKGISQISEPGQPFFWPEADQALFSSLRRHLDRRIERIELDCAINDPLFAEACAASLLAKLR